LSSKARLWLGLFLAVILVVGDCLLQPGFGGFAIIMLALASVAVFAYRML
jgi:hypothetical protein